LIAAGRDRATPSAVLARGTRSDSQRPVGRLEELAALAAEVGEGPAILVIGEVAARSAPWRAAQVEAGSAQEAPCPRRCSRISGSQGRSSSPPTGWAMARSSIAPPTAAGRRIWLRPRW